MSPLPWAWKLIFPVFGTVLVTELDLCYPLCLTYSTCQFNWSFGANLGCLTSLIPNMLENTSQITGTGWRSMSVWILIGFVVHCSNICAPKYYTKVHRFFFLRQIYVKTDWIACCLRTGRYLFSMTKFSQILQEPQLLKDMKS